ncbi:hypothetical protein BDB01DRAFT_114407 [Pilobolus umbonatus]|nr:hypothetical protein BDB01DRAFT_114407 [Pilobolus umbonatus]
MRVGRYILPNIMALLSSSCCIIQLILNACSISCAGFSVLTPYRPFFTAMTMVAVVHTMYDRFKNRSTMVTLLITLLIMISPEIVQRVNQHSSVPAQHHYQLRIEGMQCVSCANRIKNTLTMMDNVMDVQLFFDNKTAIVNSRMDDSSRVIAMIESIDNTYRAYLIN